MASKVDKISEMEIGENFQRTRNRRQNNEKTIAKVLFSVKKAWERYLAAQFVEAGHGKCQPKFYLCRAFYYFPVWGDSILESIEEPLTKKASKTAVLC